MRRCLLLLAVLCAGLSPAAHVMRAGAASLGPPAPGAGLPGRAPAAAGYASVAPNPVADENRQPGTSRWRSAELDRAPGDARRLSSAVGALLWVDSAIRGYADPASVNRGASVRLYVGTSQPGYSIEIYRMGWYGGAGGRLLQTISGLPGQNQPLPVADPITGLIAANWQVSYTVQVSTAWVTGVYLAKLIAAGGQTGYIPFVVRDDGAAADLVYTLPLTTYQAYNNWGGKSLYDYNSAGGRAYKVSFDRPYTEYAGAGYFFTGDYGAIRWLEAQGYNITYATSIDLHGNPALFNGRKAFVSVWHDEYWSRAMRDNLTTARDRGVHLAFFDSDNISWQVRFEPASGGAPNRVLVCYKDASLDPLRATQPQLTTVLWKDPLLAQPANALVGVMSSTLIDWGTSVPWVVTHAEHWIYAGTALQNGSLIAGLVGYETDRVWDNGRTPANLTVLSNSPIVGTDGVAAVANGTIYTAPSGALVFAAGTNYWAWKLDDNPYQQHGADARVQRMTANLLARMLAGASPPVGASLAIYGDGLAPGWVNWSWNASTDFAVTGTVYAGTRAIAATVTAPWGALSLHTDTVLDTTPYSVVRLAVQASQAGQSVAIGLVDAAIQRIGLPVPLNRYGGDPPVGAWKLYQIPLADLGGAARGISGLFIQDAIGRAQPPLFVDEISLGGTSAPAATQPVYDDGLAPGWANWSWGGSVNLANAGPVFAGSRSISFTATSAWAGLFLHTDTGVDTAAFTYLQFAARAAAPGQTYSVQLRDAAGTPLAPVRPLAASGGEPPAGAWQTYTIRLADLGAAQALVKDVIVQAGTAVPSTLYVDSLAFTR